MSPWSWDDPTAPPLADPVFRSEVENVSFPPRLQPGDGPEGRNKDGLTVVLLQVSRDPEHLAAGAAAVRLLSGVEAQVRLQVVPQTEAFAALGAHVRLLAGVEAPVATEALPQGERLRARRTRVRLLSGVEALVPPQDLPPREGLVADGADVPLPGVGDHLL